MSTNDDMCYTRERSSYRVEGASGFPLPNRSWVSAPAAGGRPLVDWKNDSHGGISERMQSFEPGANDGSIVPER